jgi:hypothetical protein
MATIYDIRRARDEFFSDSFDELVEKILDLRDELSEVRGNAAAIADDFHADTDEDAALALSEMRAAVADLGNGK